ncbi:MAG: agmatine deiminase family protein [Proteobacteria bacterium]|nr:agmatine deiminase family protein [Pseudomonadota bacterium]
MPAEFEPHAATWMAWPTRREIWGERFEAVKSDYAALARVIARFEPVRMVANAIDVAEAATQCGPAVEIVALPIDDSWTRDSGPVFVATADGQRAAVSFRFTAWGHKYQPFDRDAALAARIAARAGVPVVDSPLAAEGGAILSDGQGTLVTTETCLLNRNRNPGITKAEVEAELRRVLGGRTIVWLPGDPTEVETDGHVDGLAAFTAPGRLLVETIADPADPRFEILRENRRALELATDARGRRFELQPIEEADRTVEVGPRYCRSYVNFYVVNGAVIAPRYGLASDERVAATLRTAFPGREVVLQPIGAIATGGGGFHCITQQEPR